MKKLDYFLLSFIIIVALLFRFYKFNTPLADLHSWRQADTASVARNFLNNGFDLLHPKYDDLSNVQSGLDNPEGYRMVEFPIYNAMFAYGYKLLPFISLEQWGRLISIFFSLVTISVIYYLTLKERNRTAGFFAGLIYATFPYIVFFSRVVLPESTALGFTMLAILFLYISNPKKQFNFIILNIFSILSFSIALLIKPTVIFYGITFSFLFFRLYSWKIIKKPLFYIYFILSFIPLILWRDYIKNFPEGIPVNEWLLTSVNTGGGLQKILFKPAFFRWVFFERINNLILGGYLTAFFVLGIITKQKKLLLFTIFISSLTYLFVFQGGNVQHEYYQTLIFPALTIFSGLGISFLYENTKIINQTIATISVIAILVFSWFFSFYQVKNYYQYSAELIQEAKIINSLTKPDEKIVTDRMGDTTLLYLCNRKGAPALFKSYEELKKLGFSYIITSSETEIDKLELSYTSIFENEKFSIFKL